MVHGDLQPILCYALSGRCGLGLARGWSFAYAIPPGVGQRGKSIENRFRLSDEAPYTNVRKHTHDFWRFGLMTLTHFRIDAVFQVILKARGEYRSKSAFTSMLRQILDVCQLKDRARFEGIFLAATYLRNSFHNNGIHRGPALDVELQDMRFKFEPGKAIDCGSFGHALGVLYEIAGCLEEILLSPPLATLKGPIFDDWVHELAQ
jgi:hypothetical protein